MEKSPLLAVFRPVIRVLSNMVASMTDEQVTGFLGEVRKVVDYVEKGGSEA